MFTFHILPVTGGNTAFTVDADGKITGRNLAIQLQAPAPGGTWGTLGKNITQLLALRDTDEFTVTYSADHKAVTAVNTADGTVDFGTITFRAPGYYQYDVIEEHTAVGVNDEAMEFEDGLRKFIYMMFPNPTTGRLQPIEDDWAQSVMADGIPAGISKATNYEKGNVHTNAGKAVFENTLKTQPVRLLKYDTADTEKVLENATFVIANCDPAHVPSGTTLGYLKRSSADVGTDPRYEWVALDQAERFTTDEHGLIDFGKLQNGSYWLVETVSPTGYKIPDNNKIPFTVSDDGVTVGSGSGFGASVTSATVSDVKIYTINAGNERLELSIYKRDGHGSEVSGAVLEIYAVNSSGERGDKLAEWTSDGTAWDPSAILSVNTLYLLHEKSAPEGHTLAADVYFYFTANGVLHTGTAIGSINASGFTLTGDRIAANNTIVMNDYKSITMPTTGSISAAVTVCMGYALIIIGAALMLKRRRGEQGEA
jgi:hypothetical protein